MMGTIKELFDYMYYRVYKFYYKWDKEDGITAAIALSGFQSLSVWLIFLLILEIISMKMEIVGYSKAISWS